jgi:hypothetical protein
MWLGSRATPGAQSRNTPCVESPSDFAGSRGAKSGDLLVAAGRRIVAQNPVRVGRQKRLRSLRGWRLAYFRLGVRPGGRRGKAREAQLCLGALGISPTRRGLTERQSWFAPLSSLNHERRRILGRLLTVRCLGAGFKTQVAFPKIDIPSSYECLRRHDKNGQHTDVVIPPDLFHGHYISERGGCRPLGGSAAGKTASGSVGTILKKKRDHSLATGRITG